MAVTVFCYSNVSASYFVAIRVCVNRTATTPYLLTYFVCQKTANSTTHNNVNVNVDSRFI